MCDLGVMGRVLGFGFSGFVLGLEFTDKRLRIRVWGKGYMDRSLGFRVLGLGIRD